MYVVDARQRLTPGGGGLLGSKVVHGGFRWYLVLYNGAWWCLLVPGSTRLSPVVLDGA